MTTKQLTGTITLPGVDPNEYELAGEVRVPDNEWFVSDAGEAVRGTSRDGGPRIILRKLPRKIRVTPTQADLDAATEPILCWVQINGKWNQTELIAIDKFSKGANYYVRLCGWCCVCEIEKDVTE